MVVISPEEISSIGGRHLAFETSLPHLSGHGQYGDLCGDSLGYFPPHVKPTPVNSCWLDNDRESTQKPS